MDAACKLSSCSCFLEGNPRQRFGPNGATLISHLAKDAAFSAVSVFDCGPWWMFRQHELREWASVRGIGLLTAPGEFHVAYGRPGESDPSYQTFGQKMS